MKKIIDSDYKGFILVKQKNHSFYAIPPENFSLSLRSQLVGAKTCGELKYAIRTLLRRDDLIEERPRRNSCYMAVVGGSCVPVFESWESILEFVNIRALHGRLTEIYPTRLPANVKMNVNYEKLRKEFLAG